jgi:hypothetical protein
LNKAVGGVNLTWVNAQELKEISSLLMLIPFGIVLGTGIFFVYMAVRWVKQRKPAAAADEDLTPSSVSQRATFRPTLFAQPSRWLAIRGANPRAVQEALGLHHAVRCSWEEGLMEAQEQKLFITPPVSGWTLVIGSNLPDPGEDIDKLYHFLANVSRKLGHVQYFHINRAVNHHAWAMVEQGRVFRAYAWAGETLWNQGPVTAAERQLSLTCLDYGFDSSGFTQKDTLQANTEKLALLASRWSVDPSSIDERHVKATQGIAGELSPSTLL